VLEDSCKVNGIRKNSHPLSNSWTNLDATWNHYVRTGGSICKIWLKSIQPLPLCESWKNGFWCGFLWPPYVAYAHILFCSCGFYLLSSSSFFLASSQPSQSGCLPYFHTWRGLSANSECRSEMVSGQLPDRPTPTRGLPTRGLDISWAGQLAD